jgi:capsular polysaccharide biosynthesis protein
VVGAILSATFFLLLIGSFKTYRSEISIMVSAKSDVAAKQQAQIISNMIELPKTLAFYDRLLKFNADVRDVAQGLSQQKREAKWNEMVSVERTALDASVVKIAITTNRQSDSVQLVNKTVRTLFDTAAFYYDVKKDVDLRIVNGPITRVQVVGWYWLLTISALSGFAVAILLSFIFFSDRKVLGEKAKFFRKNFFFDLKKKTARPVEDELESLNDLYRAEQSEQPFVFEEEAENIVPVHEEKFQEIKKITKELEPSKYPNFPEMPVRMQGRASAPDNLPIGDDDTFLFQSNIAPAIEVKEEEASPKIEEDTKAEPTEEELKKRLNSLLKGEL